MIKTDIYNNIKCIKKDENAKAGKCGCSKCDVETGNSFTFLGLQDMEVSEINNIKIKEDERKKFKILPGHHKFLSIIDNENTVIGKNNQNGFILVTDDTVNLFLTDFED